MKKAKQMAQATEPMLLKKELEELAPGGSLRSRQMISENSVL